MKNKKDPRILTCDEALELLEIHMEGKKQRVHSMEGGLGIMAGCDIDLTDVKKYLKEAEFISLSGPNMKAMGHAVVFSRKDKGYLFLQTDRKKIDAIFKARKIKD